MGSFKYKVIKLSLHCDITEIQEKTINVCYFYLDVRIKRILLIIAT